MVRIGFFTCVFLIGLRLVIGWHFFFEGVNKYETTQRGESERSKPFTSSAYFAGAQGPLGSVTREVFGDADSQMLAKLTLVASGDEKSAKMPKALAQEWEAYLKKFTEDYKLDEVNRRLAEGKLEQAKTDYVLWLTKAPAPLSDAFRNDEKAKKIKKTIDGSTNTVTYEIPDHPQQRVLDYQARLLAIQDGIHRVSPSFGKDVEKGHIATMRSEAAALRSAFQKDIDEHSQKYRDSLAKLVSSKLTGFSYGIPESMLVDDRVLDLLTLRDGPSDPNASVDQMISRMPATLDQQWNDYLAYVRDVGKDALRKDPQRGDQILAEEKLRYVRFLLDFDEYVTGAVSPDKQEADKARSVVFVIGSGAWPIVSEGKQVDRLRAYNQAVWKLRRAQQTYRDDPSVLHLIALAKAMEEPKEYRTSYVAEVTRRTEILKQNIGGFKEAGYKGITEVEKSPTRFLWRDWPTTRQDWMDWATRWGLLIGGGCMLLGLFTRLACLGCAFFLITEYLLNSPFPWLPVSPRAEGSYVFVNKNIVELLGLLVLATLPTGRWFGFDAILSRIWPFRSRRKPRSA